MKYKDEVYYDIYRRVLAAEVVRGWTPTQIADRAERITDAAVDLLLKKGVIE